LTLTIPERKKIDDKINLSAVRSLLISENDCTLS
jgi:hypothetical protein